MRRIEKRPEPAGLTARRKTPGATSWTAVGEEKGEMREALFAEQHGLCAYCMGRLAGTDRESMRIEHWEPRSTARGRRMQLTWTNLLGVCPGEIAGDGKPEKRFHCDAFRRDKPLHVHPAEFPPDAAHLFRYAGDGQILAAQRAGTPSTSQIEQTIDHLNLNAERLRRNRASIIGRLRRRLDGGMTKAQLEALLAEQSIPRGGRLPEQCEVAAYYLRKKKRQKGW